MLAGMTAVYGSHGFCVLGLGAVGTAVPGLPTTPFMLLALWAFSRSSERFHNWLYNHPFFGPPLQQWHEHRVIPRNAKILSISMMILSLGYMVIFTEVGVWLKVTTFLIMLYGAWYILTKPSVYSTKE